MPRGSIKVSKWFVIISLAVFVVSVPWLLVSYNLPDEVEQKATLVEYEHQGRFDYLVYLKPSYLFGPPPQEPLPNQKYPAELVDTIDFFLPSDPLQIWAIDFDGEFEGIVTLTLGYDDAGLLVPEENLRIYHQLEDIPYWEILPVVSHDLLNNRITVTTTGFSDFVLGAVIPLPAAVWLALPLLGGLGITRFVKKRRAA